MTFGSAHKALKAELILKAAGIRMRLLPAPKRLAEHCALVVQVDDLQGASAELAKKALKPNGVYIKEGDDYVKM